jgi:hypothetical protein
MGHSLNRTSFRINQNLIIDDKYYPLYESQTNPSYILISDIYGNASWKNPTQYINGVEPLDHFIGELYGGGIVVAVWRENRPYLNFFGATEYDLYEICLIASVKNYSEPYSEGEYFYFQWSNIANLAIGATARSNTFGASNSVAIVNQGLPLGPTNPADKAASKCANYINADLYGLGIYSDWYLPSTFELNCLANNAAIVDRVISQYATDKGLSLVYNENTGAFSNMDLFENNYLFSLQTTASYWTSTEYNAGSAHSLNMGVSDGVRFGTASKNSYKFVRPFRQDVRKWDGNGWVPETQEYLPGTTPLAQYEYLLITYIYSFDGIQRDMDSATFFMGTGTAEDYKRVGCGQPNGYVTPIDGGPINSSYLWQNGDDVGNGKGESIIVNFENLRTAGISVNQNVSVELYGGWHSNSTWPNAQGNLVSVSIKTYVGGTLTLSPGLNTITSSGTCIQDIRYNNFPVSGQPGSGSSGFAGCGADPLTKKTRVGTINYNLTTKVSSVTFY